MRWFCCCHSPYSMYRYSGLILPGIFTQHGHVCIHVLRMYCTCEKETTKKSDVQHWLMDSAWDGPEFGHFDEENTMKHKIAAATVTRAAMRFVAWTWISNSILTYISFVSYTFFLAVASLCAKKCNKISSRFRNAGQAKQKSVQAVCTSLRMLITSTVLQCATHFYRSHINCIQTSLGSFVVLCAVSISFGDGNEEKKTVLLSFEFIESFCLFTLIPSSAKLFLIQCLFDTWCVHIESDKKIMRSGSQFIWRLRWKILVIYMTTNWRSH